MKSLVALALAGALLLALVRRAAAAPPGAQKCEAAVELASASYAYTPSYAWSVGFHYGYVELDGKTNESYLRAVRAGS